MELKHIHAQSRASKHAGFNRTFMELKQANEIIEAAKVATVLIGPSWN